MQLISTAASSSSSSFSNGNIIDVDATAVEEKRLQSNPRGKKKGEKFRCAAGIPLHGPIQ